MIYQSLLVLSWLFIIFGVIGLFRFSNIYTRFLISSKIDTVAFITIITALIIRNGFSPSSFKLLIILAFFVITTPLSTHLLARSAYLYGIPVKSEMKGMRQYGETTSDSAKFNNYLHD